MDICLVGDPIAISWFRRVYLFEEGKEEDEYLSHIKKTWFSDPVIVHTDVANLKKHMPIYYVCYEDFAKDPQIDPLKNYNMKMSMHVARRIGVIHGIIVITWDECPAVGKNPTFCVGKSISATKQQAKEAFARGDNKYNGLLRLNFFWHSAPDVKTAITLCLGEKIEN